MCGHGETRAHRRLRRVMNSSCCGAESVVGLHALILLAHLIYFLTHSNDDDDDDLQLRANNPTNRPTDSQLFSPFVGHCAVAARRKKSIAGRRSIGCESDETSAAVADCAAQSESSRRRVRMLFCEQESSRVGGRDGRCLPVYSVVVLFRAATRWPRQLWIV